jgi:phosphoribosylformimino-5-aminoimidazole carboxamide ribotide isomerase
MGVARVVLGTLAIEQPAVLSQAVTRWGAEQVAAGLDARAGLVQVRGWQQSTPLSVLEAAQRMAQAGVTWLVFTDIARDGLQRGINLEATVQLARQSGLKVVASGGVSQAADVQAVRQAGLAGGIIGRGLYEGMVKLNEVLC